VSDHGAAYKRDDLFVLFGCSYCHAVLDGPRSKWPEGMWEYIAHAMAETQRRLYEKGLIVIQGAA